MAKIDHEYNNLLGEILSKGFRYEDPNRKGTYRRQIQSHKFIWDFKDGFPAITTKKLWWKGIVGELLFFLQGDMDIRKLWENSIYIWDKDWMNFNGRRIFGDIETAILVKDTHLLASDYSLGKIYGYQYRHWEEELDQFSNLIESLRVNPMSTSNIVSAWNPSDKKDMALPPCHWSFEILSRPLSISEQTLFKSDDSDKGWTVDRDRPTHAFTLKWHQRSVDTFLGLPFNIASYALLAQIIGKMTNMIPTGIIGDLSNVHIYEPHMEAVKLQLDNDVNKYKETNLVIEDKAQLLFNKFEGFKNGLTSVDFGYYNNVSAVLNSLEISDFKLENYESYPPIKAEMIAYNKK